MCIRDRHLTGGNPRTTTILFELIASNEQNDVRADLERLLDNMTPLYKAKIETLAEQSRVVFAHILENWQPITQKELVSVSHLPAGTVSSQLTRLQEEGLIEKVRIPHTTRKGYQATERLLNIYYLMRNAPRRLRIKLGWLITFMKLWYSPNELKDMGRDRQQQHQAGILTSAADYEYSKAVSYAIDDYS